MENYKNIPSKFKYTFNGDFTIQAANSNRSTELSQVIHYFCTNLFTTGNKLRSDFEGPKVRGKSFRLEM